MLRRGSGPAAVLLLCLGCSENLTILRTAEPNPFAGYVHFHVAPPDYSRTTVNGKPAAPRMAAGDNDDATDWRQSTIKATQSFAEGLANAQGATLFTMLARPGVGDVLVVPILERVSTDTYLAYKGQRGHSTRVDVRVIVYANGAPADELTLMEIRHASLTDTSFNDRLADCMGDIARDMARYLAGRAATTRSSPS